jgi:hypothetical protein
MASQTNLSKSKLKQTLANFKESSLDPLQQSFLDSHSKLEDKMSQVLALYDNIPQPCIIDPFTQWLNEPLPAFYRYTATATELDAAFNENLSELLTIYRRRRHDAPDKVYTDSENERDFYELTYMHTLWCQRINTIQSNVSAHKVTQSSSTQSSPSLDDHIDKKNCSNPMINSPSSVSPVPS